MQTEIIEEKPIDLCLKIDVDKSKFCNGCTTLKPISEFHECPRFKKGKLPRCKDCVKRKNQEYYRKHQEKKKKEAEEIIKNAVNDADGEIFELELYEDNIIEIPINKVNKIPYPSCAECQKDLSGCHSVNYWNSDKKRFLQYCFKCSFINFKF